MTKKQYERMALDANRPENTDWVDDTNGDMMRFLGDAMHCLMEVLVNGRKADSPEGLCNRHPEYFRAFMNQFIAMYRAHREEPPEFLHMVRIGSEAMQVECMVNRDSAFYGSPDPDHLPNALKRFMRNMHRNIAISNEDSKHRSAWGGLREPDTHMRTVAGGRS